MPNEYPHNRLRQLKGLVTIDPWHEPQSGSSRVELHAYVYFEEARLGGEQGDEILFRLQLRRAEIKLLQSEPRSFDVDPAQIWRGDRDAFGKLVRTHESDASSGNTGTLATHIGTDKASLSANLGQTASSTARERAEFTTSASSKTIMVSFQRNSREQPTWVLRPTEGAPLLQNRPVLSGQPWDDKEQRLLSLKVNQKHAASEMLSCLRLCLFCRREDIIFYDIQVRGADGLFTAIEDSAPKRVVIQEYLRSALIAEGLHAGDMDSPFAIIALGEAISEPRTDA